MQNEAAVRDDVSTLSLDASQLIAIEYVEVISYLKVFFTKFEKK